MVFRDLFYLSLCAGEKDGAMATVQPSEGPVSFFLSHHPWISPLSLVSPEAVAAPCDWAKLDTDASVDTDEDSSILSPVVLNTHWPPVSSESGLTSSNCVQAPARPNSVLSCLPPQSDLY